MNPPDIKDALTNELTLKKLSLAFEELFNLPALKYKLVRYREEPTDTKFTVSLVLRAGKLTVDLTLSGPHIQGQFDWGLSKDKPVEVLGANGTKTVFIKGYLRPA